MIDPKLTPSLPSLLQRFFVEHLGKQRAVSSRTIAAYRDTFRLLLDFAEATGPTRLTLADLDAQLILSRPLGEGAEQRRPYSQRPPGGASLFP